MQWVVNFHGLLETLSMFDGVGQFPCATMIKKLPTESNSPPPLILNLTSTVQFTYVRILKCTVSQRPCGTWFFGRPGDPFDCQLCKNNSKKNVDTTKKNEGQNFVVRELMNIGGVSLSRNQLKF